MSPYSKSYTQWEDDTFSSLLILDGATKSQKDHKLFSATYILCSEKFCNKKIEGFPFIGHSPTVIQISFKKCLNIVQIQYLLRQI